MNGQPFPSGQPPVTWGDGLHFIAAMKWCVTLLSRALVSTTSSLLLLLSFSENGAKSELDVYIFGNWEMVVCMKNGCPVLENVVCCV